MCIGVRSHETCLHLLNQNEYKIGTTSAFRARFCVLLGCQPCRKINELPLPLQPVTHEVAGSSPVVPAKLCRFNRLQLVLKGRLIFPRPHTFFLTNHWSGQSTLLPCRPLQ